MAEQNSGIVRRQISSDGGSTTSEKEIDEVGMEARQLYEKGYGLLEKKQYDYAMELLIMALEKEPAFFECRMSLRAAQVKKNESAGSLSKMAGTAANAHNMAQAKVALARNNYFGALVHAEKILCADPESSVAHRAIVESAGALNFPQTMISSLQILKKTNPDEQELTRELATALEMLGDWDQAEGVMRKLAATNPDDPVLQQAYKDTAAKATIFRGNYEKTFEGGGDDEEDNVGGPILTAEQALEERVYVMEERLQEEPENFKLGVDIAKLYVEMKDFERAFEYYEWVKEENKIPDSNIDKAFADACEAQFNHQIDQLSPDSGKRETLESERDEFLLKNCHERVELYPTMPEIRYELGERLFHAGRMNEAIQSFQRAQNSPKHKLDSLNYLGKCFMSRGLYDMSLSQFEKALSEKGVFDEQKKDLVYNIACVYEELQRHEEAQRHFKSIYEVDISFRDVAQRVEKGYPEGA